MMTQRVVFFCGFALLGCVARLPRAAAAACLWEKSEVEKPGFGLFFVVLYIYIPQGVQPGP